MTEDLFRVIFAMKLREAAKQIGMSYSDIAKFTGISKSTVYYYFKGVRLPDLIKLNKICEVLMINPSDLMDFNQYNVNPSFTMEGSDIYETIRKRV